MHKKDAEDLLQRYNAGNATEEEKAWVESWYLQFQPDTANSEIPPNLVANDREESMENLLGAIRTKRRMHLSRRLVVAASIMVILFSGMYLWKGEKTPTDQLVAHRLAVQDIAPGGNKVILTLSNGSQIALTDSHNGQIATEGGTIINKTADGQLSYLGSGNDQVATGNLYNTATTPRGGQYQLVLSDGTKVWLNAASSIKYPVVFSGSDRSVELTGEAYFEVMQDVKKPFRVVSNGQVVEVLGTRFNINSYSDEAAIKTTLLQGSIRVLAGGKSNNIRPGEQAQVKNGMIRVADADAEGAIAWKNGLFNFKDAGIESVMRQMARWYDVEVKYEGTIPTREFSGDISRNLKASQLLDVLTFKKIHYRIENKTIVITP